MRSVFQEQPEVAHVYLGSKRHMMERIFSDENEPFWRSAKRMELDVIAPPLFRPFIQEQFERTGRTIDPAVLDRLLDSQTELERGARRNEVLPRLRRELAERQGEVDRLKAESAKLRADLERLRNIDLQTLPGIKK